MRRLPLLASLGTLFLAALLAAWAPKAGAAPSLQAAARKPPVIKPITYGVFWTPDAATYFGGDRGMEAVASVDVRDKIRIALLNSGFLPSQGYDLKLMTFPGVVKDDIAPGAAGGNCDLTQITVNFRLNPVVQLIRRTKKLSLLTLLVQCHDVNQRFGIGFAPSRPRDFADWGSGIAIIEAGSLSTNLVAVHEFAHAFGGCHPDGCGGPDSIGQPRTQRSAYAYALGVRLPGLGAGAPCQGDALVIGGCVALPFFSHPGVDQYGRHLGDKNHDVTRAIRENWAQVYGLGSLR
jgi:hypothetical protein